MSRSKKYSKKRPIKAFSIGLLLLCSVSLLSVGFSTWYYGVDSKGEGTVQIEIADTVDKNSFITFDGDAEVFDFCKYGIIDEENEMIAYKGDIIVGFSINVSYLNDSVKTYFSTELTDFDLSTTFSHKYNDFDNLLNSYLKSVSLGVSATEISSYDITPISNTASSSSYKSDFDLTPDLTAETLYFKVKYSFEFPQSSFETDVYSKITHNDLVFYFGAEVIF